MARPKNSFAVTRRTVRLPNRLSAAIDERFRDPVTGTVGYGALSEYLTNLALNDMKSYNSVLELLDDNDENE